MKKVKQIELQWVPMMVTRNANAMTHLPQIVEATGGMQILVIGNLQTVIQQKRNAVLLKILSMMKIIFI